MRQKKIKHKKSLLILVFAFLLLSLFKADERAFAYTSMNQDQAIAWVQSMVGKGIDDDGAYGNQCVDLIRAYYRTLGVSPVSGNGVDYSRNALPSGWTRVQGGTPQKGDILVFNGNSSNPYGHVAIYESDYVTYHQNFNNIQVVQRVTSVRYDGVNNTYWGYIRPDWGAWYTPYGPLYLGDDFYARILLNSKFAVTIDHSANDNVELADMTDTDINSASYKAQYFHFIRNDDKSYRILSPFYNNRPLIATGTSSGDNVKLGIPAYAGDSGQKWFLYDPGQLGVGNYIVRNGASPFVFNIHNQGSAPGTNLQIWTYTNSGAEHFLIERHNPVGPTELSVVPGKAGSAASFSWPSSGSEAKWYNLIVTELNSDGSAGKSYSKYYLTGLSATINLPKGDYKAKVETNSPFNSAESSLVYFSVKADTNGSSGTQTPSESTSADPQNGDSGDKNASVKKSVGKGATAKAAESAITTLKTDTDPKGAMFAPLMLKSTKQTVSSVTLSWTKVPKAKKYVVYGNKCGKTNKPVKLGTSTGKSKKITKVAGARIKKGTYYKFLIVALNSNNKVVSTSKMIHAASSGSSSRSNPAGVTVKAKVSSKGKSLKKYTKTSAIAIKKGKSTILKAANTVSGNKAVKKHVNIRFESSNKKIASVSSKGEVKGIKKGTCYIYAYAQNGVCKKIKVTVK